MIKIIIQQVFLKMQTTPKLSIYSIQGTHFLYGIILAGHIVNRGELLDLLSEYVSKYEILMFFDPRITASTF